MLREHGWVYLYFLFKRMESKTVQNETSSERKKKIMNIDSVGWKVNLLCARIMYVQSDWYIRLPFKVVINCLNRWAYNLLESMRAYMRLCHVNGCVCLFGCLVFAPNNKEVYTAHQLGRFCLTKQPSFMYW